MRGIPVKRFMNAAELAGVREVTTTRTFIVEGRNGSRAVVEYSIDRDELHCSLHKATNNCTCSGLIRMCGIITHTVGDRKPVIQLDNEFIPVVHFDIAAMASAAQEKA